MDHFGHMIAWREDYAARMELKAIQISLDLREGIAGLFTRMSAYHAKKAKELLDEEARQLQSDEAPGVQPEA